MGTITAVKTPSNARHLQVQAQEIPSYLKHVGDSKQVYGRGTGRDPAVEHDGISPIIPKGHNTIGIGGKFEEKEP